MGRQAAWNTYYMYRQVVICLWIEARTQQHIAEQYRQNGKTLQAISRMERVGATLDLLEPYVTLMEKALKQATKPTACERFNNWVRGIIA